MTTLLSRLFVWHGMLDFRRTPSAKRDWHGPLNGQMARQKLVLTILHRLDLGAVVETGSFRGCTTEFLSSLTSLPVHSVESNPETMVSPRLACGVARTARYTSAAAKPCSPKSSANTPAVQSLSFSTLMPIGMTTSLYAMKSP